MSHIFGAAKPVFAWLDEEDGEVCDLLQGHIAAFPRLAAGGEEKSASQQDERSGDNSARMPINHQFV
jgi:hypothetical protein